MGFYERRSVRKGRQEAGEGLSVEEHGFVRETAPRLREGNADPVGLFDYLVTNSLLYDK